MGSTLSGAPRHVAYYRAHFLESIRPDGIVCLECGKLRKALGNHVLLGHEMSLDAYREKWGFNRQTAFVAASTAAKLRRLALARKLGAHGSAALLVKARAARRWDKPWRLQARIETSEAKKRLYANGWQPRRYRKVDDRTLRRLGKQGLSLKRLARKSGLSVDQARKRLQALGLLSPHRRRRLIDREPILRLRRQGLWPSRPPASCGSSRKSSGRSFRSLPSGGHHPYALAPATDPETPHERR